MTKNIIIVFLVAIIATGGYMYFTQKKTSPTIAPVALEQADDSVEEDAAQDAPQTTAANMTGVWRSTRDTKFTREIRSDFTIIDRYEGEASAGLNGEWAVANPSAINIPGVSASSLEGQTLIQATWEGGVEVTFFVITELTPSLMTVRDLTGNGEVTTFTKVK